MKVISDEAGFSPISDNVAAQVYDRAQAYM